MKDLCSGKLRLIPFDGKSDAHAKRLYHQRIGCGWAEDEIEAWRVKHEKGEKGLFWLVSPFFPAQSLDARLCPGS
jgi:hypothetical protein